MTETNATILIPDISGFTAFMTKTELGHGSHAINLLIDAILTAVGEEYEVSEIEGDAVLLIKKGPPPTKKEITDTCLKIFNAFHLKRKWIEKYTVCPCGACQVIGHLTLKFVAHHGPLAEIKAGRFTVHSGTEMIVAHRLLKNSIDNHEYLLLTEKLWQMADSPEAVEMEWSSSSEEYDSIGKIDYRFALLNDARKNSPEPPAPKSYYRTDDTPYVEVKIAANFRDVYMTMMNIPGRTEWMPQLKEVVQDTPDIVIGSIHHCLFEEYEVIVSPLRMTLSDDKIIYAESCLIKDLNLSLVHEFIFTKTGENSCAFASRILNAGESPIPEEVNAALLSKMKKMAEMLKVYCEKMNT